ncbi:hypothetical protein GCM10022204_45760 [Microlunatus aurantiacus]|uniref:KTSC domain-containing protein n=1 Tax=Microlunatus aurantiacus TaxID=446786 RepID=A0ABP7EKK6_9ACTN
MIEWIDCQDSSRLIAVAYDVEEERILVRFRNGTEWQYLGCPPVVWDNFTAPGVSKGRFIHEELNYHAHSPLVS